MSEYIFDKEKWRRMTIFEQMGISARKLGGLFRRNGAAMKRP